MIIHNITYVNTCIGYMDDKDYDYRGSTKKSFVFETPEDARKYYNYLKEYTVKGQNMFSENIINSYPNENSVLTKYESITRYLYIIPETLDIKKCIVSARFCIDITKLKPSVILEINIDTFNTNIMGNIEVMSIKNDNIPVVNAKILRELARTSNHIIRTNDGLKFFNGLDIQSKPHDGYTISVQSIEDYTPAINNKPYKKNKTSNKSIDLNLDESDDLISHGWEIW